MTFMSIPAKRSQIAVYLFLLFMCMVGRMTPVYAQSNQVESPADVYVKGVVEEVGALQIDETHVTDGYQQVRVRLQEDLGEGVEIEAEYANNQSTDADNLRVGDRVVVLRTMAFADELRYIVTDFNRLPALALLVGAFVLCAILFAGRRGLTSVLGLVFSFSVLMWYTVPSIAAGADPFLTATVSVFAIAIVSLFVAHGFSKQTGYALLSTLITLLLSLGLAQVFVRVAHLVGIGSEDALFLQFSGLGEIDLRGLLLAGIVIGVLGVLDDVTTAQTAAVKEIAEASSGLSWKDLYRRGISVGREHIVSLVNTLALAYVGVSLPLLLLFSTNEGQVPTWLVLNGEIVSEEIVRMLIGSTVLILAVPIATLVAARAYQKR